MGSSARHGIQPYAANRWSLLEESNTGLIVKVEKPVPTGHSYISVHILTTNLWHIYIALAWLPYDSHRDIFQGDRPVKEYVQDICTHLARIDSTDEHKRSYLVQGLGDEQFCQVCMTTYGCKVMPL